MPRALIAYASHYGQTRTIAERIADRLRARDVTVDVIDLCGRGASPGPPPTSYELVVVGSRIETGRHASEAIAYLRAHLDLLERVPTAVFSVSNAAARAGAGRDPNGYLAALFDDLSWTPTRSVAFAGALPYRRYNWLLRFVMKRISRSAGLTTDTTRNHEMTDWGAVERFADELVTLISSPSRDAPRPGLERPSAGSARPMLRVRT